MRRVKAAITRLGPSGTTVLIHGETGTGKELVARAIHEESGRERFVSVSVPELSEGVLESELFGHTRGAFTGAVASRPGLFESATGGTLFLDEIGDTPLPIQVKLLRALETRQVRPVGSSAARSVDVRIVAATNRDLPEMVRRGHFREDLFYRLRGATIHLPPLRQRTGDIEAIALALLEEIAATTRVPIPKLDPGFAAALARCPWRGNVRELRAVLENVVLWSDGDGPLERAQLVEALVAMNPDLTPEDQLLAQKMLDAFRRHSWNQEAARRELGLTRGEWRSRAARLGLDAVRRRRR
jgi:transcriptional regulator with GAF, ATPase, and Fis domain